MAKELTPQSEFLVKEEKILLYILIGLCAALFIYGLVESISGVFSIKNYSQYVALLALIPAIILWQKIKNDRVYIRINRTGIYTDEKLLTDWPRFINAFITEKQKTLSIQDNFLLVIEFTKDDPTKGVRRKLPLTNTQNKSEEDILAAIKYFWVLFRHNR